MGNELAAFFTSDLSVAGREVACGTIQAFGANSLAHFSIGSIAGAGVFLLRRSLAWLVVPLMLIALKEIFFDMPNAGHAWPVILDSLWDLACYTIGFFFVFWAVMFSPSGDAA